MPAELSVAQAAKLQRWQTLVFVALFGGYFLYTAGRRGVTAAQESLKSELGFTMSDIGTLNSAFTAAYGLSKFIGNIMTDFFSAKQLFVLGLAAAGVANLVMGVSSSLNVSVLVWALNGALQGLGWPALSELVMRWFQPNKRGAVWSTCTVSGNVAKTVSPVVLAFVAAQFGWRAALFAPGGAALLAAAFIFVALRDAPEDVGLPPILTPPPGTKSDAKQVCACVRECVGAWVVVCIRACMRARVCRTPPRPLIFCIQLSFLLCAGNACELGRGRHLHRLLAGHSRRRVRLFRAAGLLRLDSALASGTARTSSAAGKLWAVLV